jgi:hypothetical protein
MTRYDWRKPMTASISALREIMLDEDVPLRRRVEAAEQILSFEASIDAVEEAKTFLTKVFDDGEVYVDLRLDALRIMRKAEARKVTAPPAIASTGERDPVYRMAQQRARNELRETLEAKGLWPAPPGWDAHIMSPDWPGPEGEPPNPIGLADRIGAARKAFLEEKMLAKEPKE